MQKPTNNAVSKALCQKHTVSSYTHSLKSHIQLKRSGGSAWKQKTVLHSCHCEALGSHLKTRHLKSAQMIIITKCYHFRQTPQDIPAQNRDTHQPLTAPKGLDVNKLQTMTAQVCRLSLSTILAHNHKTKEFIISHKTSCKQQQRPESLTVTLTWDMNKHKVRKSCWKRILKSSRYLKCYYD